MTKLSNAICFATELFDGIYRKAENCPAIFHSLEAASIVQNVCGDEDVVCASVLHDTIEDAGATLLQIKEKFGERVAYLVSTETENKYLGINPSDTWLKRKEETLKILKESDDMGVKALWLGDKLSNMRSFLRLKECKGDEMWQYFHQKDPKKQRAYYDTIANELKVFEETKEYKEFVSLINKVFGE